MNAVERHEERLPNGLTLLAEVHPYRKSSSIGFFVRTGSRDETEKEAGISHFLEHMMFKGTPTRSALEITYQLGNLAAQANAYTSNDMTVYYASVLPKYFPQMQELLTDMLRPALDREEFDMEKKVILEEIALYQDKPGYFLYEKAVRQFFSDHAAGNSVLGTTDSVGAIERDEMADYFNRRYSPSNMCLVATGNIDWTEFRKKALELCGNWKDVPAHRELASHTSVQSTLDLTKEKLAMSQLIYMIPSAGIEEEAYTASLDVLATILGDSSGSKLYWDLVDTGIAESAGAEFEGKEGVGIFSLYASFLPEQEQEVRQILEKNLLEIEQFEDDQLERAKTKLMTSLVLDGEMPMGRLMSIGGEWTYRRRFHDLERETEALREVNRQTIAAALQKYPVQDWSMFVLRPKDAAEESAAIENAAE